MPYTPKKTIDQIIESENDYIIPVKKNQPKLHQSLTDAFQQRPPQSVNDQLEHSRNRTTQRIVTVLEAGEDFDVEWRGVKRLIQVERFGMRGDEFYEERMFYISSLACGADDFSLRIREHWHIENRLHWVKDLVLAEDTAPMTDGYAPANVAILRTVVVNLFRQKGYSSITKGIRAVAHDIPQLFSFFQ